MRSIHNAASAFFVCAVAILAGISILGVWDLFSGDVIVKSFQTLGILALFSLVVIVAGRYLEAKPVDVAGQVPMPYLPSPIFRTMRQSALGVLIVSAVLLALVGIMSVWDVISDKSVLYKSLSSLGILAFACFIIVVTCLEREDNPMLKNQMKLSGGAIVGLIVLGYIFLSLLTGF